MAFKSKKKKREELDQCEGFLLWFCARWHMPITFSCVSAKIRDAGAWYYIYIFAVPAARRIMPRERMNNDVRWCMWVTGRAAVVCVCVPLSLSRLDNWFAHTLVGAHKCHTMTGKHLWQLRVYSSSVCFCALHFEFVLYNRSVARKGARFLTLAQSAIYYIVSSICINRTSALSTHTAYNRELLILIVINRFSYSTRQSLTLSVKKPF